MGILNKNKISFINSALLCSGRHFCWGVISFLLKSKKSILCLISIKVEKVSLRERIPGGEEERERDREVVVGWGEGEKEREKEKAGGSYFAKHILKE